MNLTRLIGLIVLLITMAPTGAAVAAAATQDPEDVTIRTIEVSKGVYMLAGRGGNIGLCVGDDGAFLIDDQFAWLTPKILDAVRELTDQPVRFVINTHWHGDHTGGNENLGEAGAVIVAHENVRRRMSTEQFVEAFDRTTPPSPESALPVVTFDDSVTLHLNDDEIHVFHVEPAHTDGDSIIHFRRANVLHMGDTYFNGIYPFIDVSSGGSIDGMIDAVERALKLCNDQTRVIPGHGPLSGVGELRSFLEMLTTVRDRIGAMVDQGMTRQEVIDARPTRPFDDAWAGGFLQTDQWVGIVYDGMTSGSSR